jgi:hypothetical protein
MPRQKSGTELESLRAQEQALQERIRQVEARDKANKARDDTRRWQLAGQVAVQHMQALPESEFFKAMMSGLNEHARSASDRALFGLSPKSSNGGTGNGGERNPLPGANIAD